MQQTIILIRLKLIISILFLKFSLAQNSTASPYSLGGLGDITFKGNVINRMMGGVSVFSDSIHANLNKHHILEVSLRCTHSSELR